MTAKKNPPRRCPHGYTSGGLRVQDLTPPPSGPAPGAPRVEWNDKPRVIVIEAALLAELRKR